MTEVASLYVSEALTSVAPRSTHEKLETPGPVMKSSPGDELTRIGPRTGAAGSEPIAVERKSWVRKQGGDPESCLQSYIGLSSGMVPRKAAELPEGPGKRGRGNES